MCGIIGEISENINVEKFIEMRDTLIHRGPDDEGIYLDDSKKVIFGHRRLSIIDLSILGKQPMTNEDGTVWITFNGEIYNFKELRIELKQLNHVFRSQSDTEVIIHGYEEWGIRIVEKLRGMFAFGIWDKKASRLFLARDRIGIKPLYYYYHKNRFIFASELKAIIKDESIKRELNPKAVECYFYKGYIPSPYSIWQNISKLPPGHYLIFENDNINIQKYWDLTIDNKEYSEEDIISQIEKLLMESINLRLISDVPLGILLSGGIDSSTILALASLIKEDLLSFSIGFEPMKFSELKYAKRVAEHLKVKNIRKKLSKSNLDANLNKIIYYYDEPFSISSVFPTFLLMQMASKRLKVVLSGDGGDELFAGYKWYSIYEKYRKYSFLHFLPNFILKLIDYIPENNNKKLRYIKKRLKILSSTNFKRYSLISDTYFPIEDFNKLFNKNYLRLLSKVDFLQEHFISGINNIKEIMMLDIKTFLVDHILVKIDRASMANSLEVRVPFLDHALINYILSLKYSLIYKNHEKKYLLKKIAKKYLPYEIITKPKKGFSAPIEELGFLDKYLYILNKSKACEDGILNSDYIRQLRNNVKNNKLKIWSLIIFELWYLKWKKGIDVIFQ